MESKHKRNMKCGMVYSPSSPVDRLQLFAGRIDQVRMVSNAISTRGRHSILYGERGVGKTSLVQVMHELFDEIEGFRITKVNCSQADTFSGVWLRAMSGFSIVYEPVAGDPDGRSIQEYTLDQFAPTEGPLLPGEICRLLRKVGSSHDATVIVFDEFDRLGAAHRSGFADTLKELSDNSINVTVLLVGVARDVNDLIAEHASISRCLSQILIPPMKSQELREIITKANMALEMSMEEEATDLIVGLSQGLPHYTHLIAQEATYLAIDRSVDRVTIADVEAGIIHAIEKTDQALRNAYLKAAEGQRRGTLFPEVLLACAMAKVNDFGEFSSTDIRSPLRAVTGRNHEISNYSQHLHKLAHDTSRGPVLEKTGTQRRFRFRFRNPLLRPFILMRGLSEGRIARNVILSGWRPGIEETRDFGDS